MNRLVATLSLLFLSAPAWAAMQAKPVDWTPGKQAFSGGLVYDDAGAARRPGAGAGPGGWPGVRSDCDGTNDERCVDGAAGGSAGDARRTRERADAHRRRHAGNADLVSAW